MLLGEFWGTSAAEGIPAPFCRCEVCMEAREKGGRNCRFRSCFRLSDKIMLDLGADAVAQSRMFGDLAEVEHVLVTHSHDDHLNPHMLMEVMWGKKYCKPVHYYFTEESYEIVNRWRENSWVLKGKVPDWEKEGTIVFHQLRFGECVQIADMKVTPLPGNHIGNVESRAGMYLIELPNGKKLFYGLDSGPYLPETIDALKEHHIDYFISEVTRGVHQISNLYHMSLYDVRELVDILYRQGTLDQNSCVYLTHISHASTHTQMLEKTEELQFPVPTVVAWDGLRIF